VAVTPENFELRARISSLLDALRESVRIASTRTATNQPDVDDPDAAPSKFERVYVQ
jgi:hypothetical protein